jgi:hypothetical protein
MPYSAAQVDIWWTFGRDGRLVPNRRYLTGLTRHTGMPRLAGRPRSSII